MSDDTLQLRLKLTPELARRLHRPKPGGWWQLRISPTTHEALVRFCDAQPGWAKPSLGQGAAHILSKSADQLNPKTSRDAASSARSLLTEALHQGGF